jgi:hypothetical protein
MTGHVRSNITPRKPRHSQFHEAGGRSNPILLQKGASDLPFVCNLISLSAISQHHQVTNFSGKQSHAITQKHKQQPLNMTAIQHTLPIRPKMTVVLKGGPGQPEDPGSRRPTRPTTIMLRTEIVASEGPQPWDPGS